uniref:Uncharacterized protein n=1 Tax=Cynoglossus semilaevis TaxID=244447 RepID=A0A3P8WJD6_CYNSE
MAVYVDCTISHLQLKNEINRLESELRKRDQLIEGFISVAAAQSKHISHLQSLTFTAPPAPSPPSPMSRIPRPPSPNRQRCTPALHLYLPARRTVHVKRAASPRTGSWTWRPWAPPGLLHQARIPQRYHTPNQANTWHRPSWTEVVRRGRSRISDASVHPNNAPAVSTSPATHCFPGATVPHILDKLQEMMHSLPTSIKSPIPTVCRGAGRFSRLLSLHAWLQSASRIYNFGFNDNFNSGSQILSANLQHVVYTFPCD